MVSAFPFGRVLPRLNAAETRDSCAFLCAVNKNWATRSESVFVCVGGVSIAFLVVDGHGGLFTAVLNLYYSQISTLSCKMRTHRASLIASNNLELSYLEHPYAERQLVYTNIVCTYVCKSSSGHYIP